MDINETKEITVKKEPSENSNGIPDEIANENPPSVTRCDATSSIPGPLRYVSRRGRPPGGGYSMKSHAHFVSFSSLPLSTSTELGSQISNGSSSSISPQDLLKSGTSAAADNLDIRRFGFPGFDTDKTSFRCDGCDVTFSSRDTYAMHMLLRAKNESCVALPTSAISSNPENPTPREKFERELRQHTMVSALRNQATAMTKAATALLSKSDVHSNTLTSLTRTGSLGRDDFSIAGVCGTDGSLNFNSLFSIDAYGVYVDPRQYRRVLEEYGLRTPSSTGSLQTMMEQLSCTDCGEIFTSKDALAMHMMFHAREDDKETSATNISWGDVHATSSQKQTSSCSSASSSPLQCAGSRKAGKSETNVAVKREINKTEERELTAERVAELKRMAIESSLRSPLKKTSTSRQSTRPKSVSQDTPISASAQDRPLSADDIRRFTTSETVSDQDKNQALFASNNSLNESNNETSRCHKRHHSIQELDTSFEVKKLAFDQSKRKRNNYDGIFYNLFCKSKKTPHSPVDSGMDKDSKERDDGKPSASGTLDSDEISESNSTPEQEGKADTEIHDNDNPKSRSIPYLDAIMSQEAVLVPLDQTKSESDANAESKKLPRDEKTQASAIDFSIGRRDSRVCTSRGAWHIEQAGHSSDHDNHSVSSRSHLSSAGNGKTDRNDRYRNLYFQYPNIDRGSFIQTDGRGQRATTTRLPSVGRQGFGLGSNHQENDRPSRGWMDESSRVSEARYCPHCEILFLDVTLFHLHVGLHNVNNPWQCNTCGLVCSGRLDFNTHVLHY